LEEEGDLKVGIEISVAKLEKILTTPVNKCYEN